MNLSELKSPIGSSKNKKRRGRGGASGHGKTSCRGHKGANARSGSTTHIGFEGGQMSLIRRLPKRGFTSKFREPYQIVNVESLNKFKDEAIVGEEELLAKGLIKNKRSNIKILGEGKLNKNLTVKAAAFSTGAKKKIEDAGGKAEIVSGVC